VNFITLPSEYHPRFALQNFIATIASTQLSRVAQEDGGSAREQLSTMENVILALSTTLFAHNGSDIAKTKMQNAKVRTVFLKGA
jgi:hypothetical protein